MVSSDIERFVRSGGGSMLIFYKTVDKSGLVSGFTVPLNCVDMLFAATGGALNH